MASGESFFGALGLMVTAVIVPFLGVLGMILYGGDHRRFFRWIGKIPMLLVCGGIIAMIGPFGVLPRCLTISYASLKIYFPSMPLLLFSLFAAIFIFYILMRRGRFLNVVGYMLTPPLLISLALIAIIGIFAAPSLGDGDPHAFSKGILEGYNTLDLLAAIFFGETVVRYFQGMEDRSLAWSAIKAGMIGMGLLCITYFAFVFLGAHYSSLLEGVAPQQMVLVLAHHLLGPTGGFVATAAIGLACLTTAIALSSVSARFISEDLTGGRLKESSALSIVLGISILISTFDFVTITSYLSPILFWCYPFIIVITVINIGLKLRRQEVAQI